MPFVVYLCFLLFASVWWISAKFGEKKLFMCNSVFFTWRDLHEAPVDPSDPEKEEVGINSALMDGTTAVTIDYFLIN